MAIYKLRPSVNTPENQVNANQSGWTPMNYTRDIIDDITEPTPGNVIDTIVSLPTPLANLDLYKRAFVTVVQGGFPSSGYFAQLVSRCLDVWEGLFNFDKNGEFITFRPWGFDRLNDLKTSRSPGQQLLGRTLDLFLRSDKPENAFRNLSGISIIKYKNIPIAGTSPYTGFFFNYHGEEAINWSDSKGKPLFRNDVVHLGQRDEEFQKFLYLFRIAANNQPFAASFRDFFSYISQSINKSPIASEIKDLEANGYNWNDFVKGYGSILKDKNGQILELISSRVDGMQLNMPGLSFNQEIDPNCQLFLKPTQKVSNLPEKPLVLAYKADPSLKYHKRNWTDSTDSPLTYVNEFEQNHGTRKLPGIGLEYPYITVGDFLDEYLINVGYSIHHKYFFTNHGENKALTYLLPLKPLFFQYFKPEDLVLNANAAADKPALHITSNSQDMVKVELRLPIVGNAYNKHISLVRYYSANSVYTREEVQQNPDGIGQIQNARIGLSIFPFQITDSERYNDFYKVMLSDSGKVDLNLSFIDATGKPMINRPKFEENQLGVDKVGVARKDVRAEKDPQSGAPALYVYEVRNTYPAGIRLEISSNTGTTSGYILPNWQVGLVKLGSKEANFAVDFGTTNSHIAYTIGAVNVVNTLTYTPDENMIIRLDAPEKTGTLSEMFDPMMGNSTQRNDILDFQRRTLLPSVLGKDKSAFGFPTRTAIVEKRAFGIDSETSIFGSQSHQFTYQTWGPQITDQTFTNLKWSEDQRNPERIKTLIMQWMYMIKTIAIKEGAHPSKVKITRFVPNSMSEWQRTNFEAIWLEVTKHVLGHENVLTLSESEAPFHKHNLSLGSDSTTAIIDIGGGTTDILIVKSDRQSSTQKAYPDSFYFAGNALYGDFHDFLEPTFITKENGLMTAYTTSAADRLKKSIKDQISGERYNLFNQMLVGKEYNSQDVIDFMFKHSETGFIEFLKGQTLAARQMRTVYLFHFAAICYYTGKKSKLNHNSLPDEIIISGTGSKYLYYITPSPTTALREFVTSMLVGTSSTRADKKLTKLINVEKPKEVTCEGGLVIRTAVEVDKNSNPLIGQDWIINGTVSEKLTNALLLSAEYNVQEAEYKKFVKCFVESCTATNIVDKFNVIIDFETIEKELLETFEQDMVKSVEKRHKGEHIQPQSPIVETPFFYPVIGAIDRLLKKLPSVA